VDITTEPFPPRRTVYAFVERQNLPGIFRTFDFASPDTTSPQRFYTTVPQQALFLMNSPFVVQQSRSFLVRPELKGAATDDERIKRLYRVAFQREPDREEITFAKQFLSTQVTASNAPAEPAAWQYGYGEFDEKSSRVKDFQKLPHFTGTAWQGGDKLPDAKLGWVMLTAEGGHVGNDLQHAAVRRWRAPRDGAIKINGMLKHDTDKGDGVHARVVSSASGGLGEWTVHNTKATTNVERVEVKRGDTVDFVTDLRGDIGFDSFTWAPRIRYVDEAGSQGGQWNAKNDFAGPQKEFKPLTSWEKYAQVLLLSNELMFVD
jgi:hypothetical protein